MAAPSERFGQLLQEKLDELDAAAEQESGLAVDAVEQLRLQAAHLVVGDDGRRWVTGAPVQFQQDPAWQRHAPPVLDIRHPARPAPRAAVGDGAEAHPQRQGRRDPDKRTASP